MSKHAPTNLRTQPVHLDKRSALPPSAVDRGDPASASNHEGHMAADEQDRLLTTAELCERWQVSGKTISRLVAKDALRSVKIGRQNRFRMSDVLNYEKRRP